MAGALKVAVLVLLAARRGAEVGAVATTIAYKNGQCHHDRRVTFDESPLAAGVASDDIVSSRPYQHAQAGDSSLARRLPFLSRGAAGRAASQKTLLDLRGGGGDIEAESTVASEPSPEASELYLPGLLETVIQRMRKVRRARWIVNS